MRREEPSFRARLTGAALLRRSVYEDVVADDATTGQAVGVVVLAALAQGFAVFGEPGGVAVLLIALAILLAAFRVALGFMDFFLFHHPVVILFALFGLLLATVGFGETFWITVGVVIELTIWAASASIAWFAGMRVLRRPATDASWDEVARGLAYANAPRLLLPLIPLIQYAPGGTPDNPAGWASVAIVIAWAAVVVWMLAAWATALRVALGFGTGRAAATAVLA